MNDGSGTFANIDHFNENLIDNIQGGVIICQLNPITGESKTLYMSDGWAKLTGYMMDDLNDQFDGNPTKLILAEDAEQASKDYIEQMRNGNSYQLQYRIQHKDGHIIWTIDRGVITETKDNININQSILTDITLLKESEEKLRISEARFRIATKSSNVAVFEFDVHSNSYLHIENAEAIFHTSAEKMIAVVENVKFKKSDFTQEDLFSVWYHSDDIPLLMSCKKVLRNASVSECEIRVVQPDNSYIWCKLNMVMVDDDHGIPVRMIGHMANVDVQHKKTDRLLLEAQSDALTGLYNKTTIKELIQKTLTTKPNSSHTLLMLDIDNFKGVNDNLGHLFGDAVLMDVCAKLKKQFFQNGIIGRIGGDEFVVFFQNLGGPEEISWRAEEICHLFRRTYAGEKFDYKISCSIGIAFSVKDDTFESLFRKADIALYQSKSKGKDQYTIYEKNTMQHLSEDSLYLPADADSGKLKIKERIFQLLYDSIDFSGSINVILSLLGQLLDVNRIYIFENSPDGNFSSMIYEWCSEIVKPNQLKYQHVPMGELRYISWFNETGILFSDNTSKLSDPVRKMVADNNPCSTFQVAIMEQGAFRGYVGYNNTIENVVNTPEQIDLMTFAARVTGTFILKKRADENVKLYNENKMSALDCMPNAIYVIDPEYRLQYINNFVNSYFPEAKPGHICYEIFMHNSSPCNNCPALKCQTQPCSAEIHNPYSDIWMISNASNICWSGQKNMRLICCQIITQYKKGHY